MFGASIKEARRFCKPWSLPPISSHAQLTPGARWRDAYTHLTEAHNVLKDDGEVAFATDKCLGGLGQAEDGNACAIYGPHTVEEAHTVEEDHAVEASGQLLWVGEVDEAFGHDVLVNQACLPDSGKCWGRPASG